METKLLVLQSHKINRSFNKYDPLWHKRTNVACFCTTTPHKTSWTKRFNTALLSIAGILGLFLLFMWFGTDHNATGNNWNVLWLNPLFLVLGFLSEKTEKLGFYLLAASLGVSALNCVVTFLPQFFNFAFLPIIVALAIIVYTRLYAKKIQDVKIGA